MNHLNDLCTARQQLILQKDKDATYRIAAMTQYIGNV
jgi:hypothetical protein